MNIGSEIKNTKEVVLVSELLLYEFDRMIQLLFLLVVSIFQRKCLFGNVKNRATISALLRENVTN